MRRVRMPLSDSCGEENEGYDREDPTHLLDLSCAAQALTPSPSAVYFALSSVYLLVTFLLAACTIFISIHSPMIAVKQGEAAQVPRLRT